MRSTKVVICSFSLVLFISLFSASAAMAQDTDGDLLPDVWETAYSCLSPLVGSTEIFSYINGPETRITYDPNGSMYQDMAWTGSEFGLVWTDNRNGGYRVYFTRLSATGAKISYDIPVSSHANTTRNLPSIAWTGSEFGVCWDDDSATIREVFFARVSARGSIGQSETRITNSSVSVVDSTIAWDPINSRYAIIWTGSAGDGRTHFTSLSSAGVPVAANVVISDGTGTDGAPEAVWNGSGFGVAWDELNTYRRLLFVEITVDGDTLAPQTVVAPGTTFNSYNPSLAWTGSQYAIAWSDFRDDNYEIYFARLTAAGALIGSSTRITNQAAHSYWPFLVWTGSQFDLTWQDERVTGTAIFYTSVSSTGVKMIADQRLTSGFGRLPITHFFGPQRLLVFFSNSYEIMASRFVPGYRDRDGDGLTEEVEYAQRTSSCLADSDGDGMDDAYEASNSCLHPAQRSPGPLVGQYDAPDIIRNIFVSGVYAYVADSAAGLRILNVSNPAAPTLVGTYNTPGSARGVYVAGGYAYIADDTFGLQIIDVSNPVAPTLTGTYYTPGNAIGIDVSGGYAYVADGTAGLQIIDVSNPAAPTFAGNYKTSGRVLATDVSGGYAYVADEPAGLRIINISNPLSPTLAGTYYLTGASGVFIANGFAYISRSSEFGIVDISNPASPILVGWSYSGGYDLMVSGKYAYLANRGLLTLDVSDPVDPTLISSYPVGPIHASSSVYVSGAYVYLGIENALLILHTPDQDVDGLSDIDEHNLGTNPCAADTDGDGLNDSAEADVLSTSPLAADTDGDGLSDSAEINTHLTNPLTADTDGDGLSDGVEINGLTSPLIADSDGDGLNDGLELNSHLTNPLMADTDGDGLGDGAEISAPAPTQPLQADTDGDGFSDGAEVEAGTNPLSGISLPASATHLVNYQGRLVDGSGLPVTGSQAMTFAIFSTLTGATAAWTETQSVTVQHGIYNVLLGSVTPLTEVVFAGPDRYLQVKVGNEILNPRARLSSVPYAIKADGLMQGRLETGSASLGLSIPAREATTSVAFRQVFAAPPQVVVGSLSGPIGGRRFVLVETNVTAGGFDVSFQSLDGQPATGTASFNYFAFGQ